jgi:hypothetical protein
MTAVALHTPEPSVIVEGDAVLIHELREEDIEYVAIAREAEDPEQVTRDCLAIGARALRGVQTTVDIAIVDKRFGEFESRLEHRTGEVVGKINAASESYLDPENGELRKMLDAMKAELDRTLGETFDPKSKESVQAKFEEVFAVGIRDLGKVVRDLVDPGNAESPLGRLGGELKQVRTALDGVTKQMAVEHAASHASAEVFELTAVKGRRFEEIVFEAVGEFAALYGDEPEAVGDTPGTKANCVGDILVRLSETDAPAQAAYVVEAKDKRMGLKEALDELDEAMANRAARAGVIVFASQEKAPISVPCRDYGNKIVVVLDKQEMDSYALRLALMTARFSIKRQSSGHGDHLDVGGALALIEEGQRELASHATIKRCHSMARKQIDAATTHTADLVLRMEAIFTALASKLR